MTTFNKLSLIAALGLIAATRVCAAFESMKIEPTVIPQLSPVMLMDGVTEGKVIFAISVSAEGALTDTLVLGYTHSALVAPCLDALKQWKVTPARLDGVPVPVQTDVAVSFTAQGVVVSHTYQLDVEGMVRRIVGEKVAYLRKSPQDLDAVPTLLASTQPQYAKAAETQGVRGTVLVHFYIDEKGAVRMPAVEGSAHPYLSEMAVAAVRSWHFAPPTSHGKPALVAVRQAFNFSR
jgi:TonB family protein